MNIKYEYDIKSNYIDDNSITADKWTLYDKILYGGFGYSEFCLPNNILMIALTIIYPPLGMISYIINNALKTKKNMLIELFININHIVYSIIYTMFLYVPGIIYTFNNTIYNDNI